MIGRCLCLGCCSIQNEDESKAVKMEIRNTPLLVSLSRCSARTTMNHAMNNTRSFSTVHSSLCRVCILFGAPRSPAPAARTLHACACAGSWHVARCGRLSAGHATRTGASSWTLGGPWGARCARDRGTGRPRDARRDDARAGAVYFTALGYFITLKFNIYSFYSQRRRRRAERGLVKSRLVICRFEIC